MDPDVTIHFYHFFLNLLLDLEKNSNTIKSMEDESASVEPTTEQTTKKVSSIQFEIKFRALLIKLYKK